MAKRRSDYIKQKNREFYVLPPGHISAILLSNSGSVPLADTKVVLLTSSDRKEGTTDADGFIEFKETPVGDYKLLLPDLNASVVVPAVPTDVEKTPVCVAGFELFGKEAASTDSGSDTEEEGPPREVLRQKDRSTGWETMER